MVVLRRDGAHWELTHGSLKAMTQPELRAVGIPVGSSRTWISADCVLWSLIGQGEHGMWATFAAAAQHGGPAREFFRAHQEGREWRAVDLLAGAQSVFREFPYQRNIQSGTFRIWSELGGKPWLNLWPFCQTPNPEYAWFAEAYPTYFWKQHFKTKKRDPSLLQTFLAEITPDEIKVSEETKHQILQPDYADAAILCLSSFALLTLDPKRILSDQGSSREEGWIFGVEKRQS